MTKFILHKAINHPSVLSIISIACFLKTGRTSCNLLSINQTKNCLVPSTCAVKWKLCNFLQWSMIINCAFQQKKSVHFSEKTRFAYKNCLKIPFSCIMYVQFTILSSKCFYSTNCTKVKNYIPVNSKLL